MFPMHRLLIMCSVAVMFATRFRFTYLFTARDHVTGETTEMAVLLGISLLLQSSIYPILSGVAWEAGWQTAVAYINISCCYCIVGLPAGVLLGFVFDVEALGSKQNKFLYVRILSANDSWHPGKTVALFRCIKFLYVRMKVSGLCSRSSNRQRTLLAVALYLGKAANDFCSFPSHFNLQDKVVFQGVGRHTNPSYGHPFTTPAAPPADNSRAKVASSAETRPKRNGKLPARSQDQVYLIGLIP